MARKTKTALEAEAEGKVVVVTKTHHLLTGVRNRTYMKRADINKSLRGKDLINNLSRISGYARYIVKDVLYYLAAMVEMKLAQDIPVIIEGIGMIKRKDAKAMVRFNDYTFRDEEVYMAASAMLMPDKYLKAALNTTPDNCVIDWREVPRPELVFAGIAEYYKEKYGEDFAKIELDRYGSKDDLEEGISIIESKRRQEEKERKKKLLKRKQENLKEARELAKEAAKEAARKAKEEGKVKPSKPAKDRVKEADSIIVVPAGKFSLLELQEEQQDKRAKSLERKQQKSLDENKEQS